MPKDLSYSQQHAREITSLTREVLSELPSVCADFLRAIEPTTQPLTRYAYACDLRLFFQYLQAEVPRFADRPPLQWTCDDLGSISAREISMYLEYLSLYYKDDEAVTNAELGKMRKLSSLRSFYHYLFKNELIKLGYEAKDYDILNDFNQTDEVIDIFAEIEKAAEGGAKYL